MQCTGCVRVVYFSYENNHQVRYAAPAQGARWTIRVTAATFTQRGKREREEMFHVESIIHMHAIHTQTLLANTRRENYVSTQQGRSMLNRAQKV